MTQNTNIKPYEDIKSNLGEKSLKNNKSMKIIETARPSLYTQVLKRRKSRQSNFGPGCIDFDYAGNSAVYNHLIQKRKDLGHPTTDQLNFEMKLRTHRCGTDYNAASPWLYPEIKEFNPK